MGRREKVRYKAPARVSRLEYQRCRWLVLVVIINSHLNTAPVQPRMEATLEVLRLQPNLVSLNSSREGPVPPPSLPQHPVSEDIQYWNKFSRDPTSELMTDCCYLSQL